MRTRVTACLVGVLLLSLTACETRAPMTDSPSAASSRPPFRSSTPGPLTPSGTPAEVSAARWEAISADLTARGVEAVPELVSAESVTWSDGSLGCPRPGRSYTQSIVDGLRVVVDAGGATYDYRFGRGSSPLLCER